MKQVRKINGNALKTKTNQGLRILREDAPYYLAGPAASEEDGNGSHDYLVPNNVYLGDSRALMRKIKPASIALSFWSPPYFVGKEYEKGVTFQDWQALLQEVIERHVEALIPGGFMVVNIANILCFGDPAMPKIQAPNIRLHRSPISKKQVLDAKLKFPNYSQ